MSSSSGMCSLATARQDAWPGNDRTKKGLAMGVGRRLGGVLLAATLAVGLSGGQAGAATHGRPEIQQALAALADAGVAGVQLRIHDDRGDWVGSAGVRELSGGKVPTDGRFRVGSITKVFVSTVVLQLVHEGRVVLDDPV